MLFTALTKVKHYYAPAAQSLNVNANPVIVNPLTRQPD